MRTALRGARKGLAMQFFYIQKKRPCVLFENVLAFDLKRQRVLIKTQGRFISNVSAFKGKRKCVSVQTPKRFFETQRCLFSGQKIPCKAPKSAIKKPPDIHPTVKSL